MNNNILTLKICPAFSIIISQSIRNLKIENFIRVSAILVAFLLILSSYSAVASDIDSKYRSISSSEPAFWSELEYSDFDLAMQEGSVEPLPANPSLDSVAKSNRSPHFLLGATSSPALILAPPTSSGPPSPAVGASSNAPESADRLTDSRKNRWKSVRKLEIAYQVLNLVDLAETIICTNRNRCEELNPMIGRNPSNGRLVAYKLATGAIHYVITRHLFNKHPDVLDEWMVGSLVLQGGVVMWNLQHCF